MFLSYRYMKQSEKQTKKATCAARKSGVKNNYEACLANFLRGIHGHDIVYVTGSPACI